MIKTVRIRDTARGDQPGSAHVVERDARQAFLLGGKRAGRIVGIAILVLLPFGFLEPFLFMIWGSIALTFLLLVVGPWIHFHYWSERESFTQVDARCPQCDGPGPLKPYLSTRFETEFTVLCPDCGQTARAYRAD